MQTQLQFSAMKKYFKKVLFLIFFGIASVFLFEVGRDVGFGFLRQNSLSQLSIGFKDTRKLEHLQLAELETKEHISKTVARTIAGKFQVGEASASITVNVAYRFYCKMSDIRLSYEKDILIINVAKLYPPEQPVIDTRSLKIHASSSWFGDDEEQLKSELLEDLSESLAQRAPLYRKHIELEARASLAEVMHGFLVKNELWGGPYYRRIKVIFDDVDEKSDILFDFERS